MSLICSKTRPVRGQYRSGSKIWEGHYDSEVEMLKGPEGRVDSRAIHDYHPLYQTCNSRPSSIFHEKRIRSRTSFLVDTKFTVEKTVRVGVRESACCNLST